MLVQPQKLKTQYTPIKLITHSDIDTEKVVNQLLKIGFSAYLLIDSDVENLKKAIDGVSNNGRYFSVGVAKMHTNILVINNRPI